MLKHNLRYWIPTRRGLLHHSTYAAPRTLRIPRQNSGRSSGLRLLTKWRSTTTGSFTQIANANKLRARLIKIGKAQIAQTIVNRRRFFRVRFGPMGSVDEADRLLAMLIDNGHNDARVVVE